MTLLSISTSIGVSQKSGGISAKQQAVDNAHTIGDWNFSVYPSSTNQGGLYKDTALTTLATNSLDEVLALKGAGATPPNVPHLKFLGTYSTPAANRTWIKDQCTNYVVPQLMIRGNESYLRFRNGLLNTSYYETDPGSFTPAKARPMSINWRIRTWPDTTFESLSFIKDNGGTIQVNDGVAFNKSVNTSAGFKYYYWQDVRVDVDAAGAILVYLDGVQIASDTAFTINMSDFKIGANGHVLSFDLGWLTIKYGAFTGTELTNLASYLDVLYPRGVMPTWPYVTNMWQNGFNQFNSTAGVKAWTPGRNVTPVFSGGSGVAGTYKYMYFYHEAADTTLFPNSNWLDNCYKVPGSFHIDTIASGNTINSVSVDGTVITGSTVNFNTSAAQTATDLASNINTFQTGSGRFFARAVNNAVQIFDKNNNYSLAVISWSVTGFTPTKVDPPRGNAFSRVPYEVSGQIFNGKAGTGAIYVMGIVIPVDSLGVEGEWIRFLWVQDNIA